LRLSGFHPSSATPGIFSEALHPDRAGQILFTVRALAAAAVLGEAIPGHIIVAGNNVGEVVAWGVGGLFRTTDTIDLVVAGPKPWTPLRAPVTG
jgi:[acyl-carrier-protein] S-malonyltransferase